MKKGADIFLAKVDKKDGDLWKIKPLIVEYDGTDHPGLTARANKGITPAVGDKVLIVTMRNNIDGSKISRYFEANEANAVIVWVFETASEITLTGDFVFDGDVNITGNLTVEGDLTVEGSVTVEGLATFQNAVNITGTLTTGAVSASSIMLPGGIDVGVLLAEYLTHTHGPGSYANAGGAVAGASGAKL